MGQITSQEALALRWAELCNDPGLRDLPYKIELNAYGTIEMSPTSTRHARFQAAVGYELARQLPAGTVMTACPIATVEGVRVPDVAWASPEFVAHGADLADIWRQAARFVDKILKGAKPADLPVEQPTRFELIINLKAANALGLKIPYAVRLRADEVIE